MDKRKQIEKIFHKYLNDQSTPVETALLVEYFNAEENETVLKELIRKELEFPNTGDPEQEGNHSLDVIFRDIKKKLKDP